MDSIHDHTWGFHLRRPIAFLSGIGLLLCLLSTPLHASPNPQMRQATQEFWEIWKAKYLRSAGEGQLYVASRKRESISEGHGYGMLATVLLAEFDPEARKNFNALLRFREAHPSCADPHLMAWRQNFNRKRAQEGDQNTATDGDLDIAYALLLAEGQWGGGKYKTEALKMADAILRHEYNPELGFLTLGNWCTPESPQWRGWRSSDFMPGHFKAFARATGDARWSQCADKGYELLRNFVAQHSATTGLVADFIDAVEVRPAPASFLEGKYDGGYYYNACRVPWRLAVDYLGSGDRRALELLRPFNEWAHKITQGDPKEFNAGYRLDGRPLKEDWSYAFVGPLALAARTEPEQQQWNKALAQALLSPSSEEEGYYGDTIKLMSLIVLSDLWR